MDKNAYLNQLQALMPRGAAWTRELSSNLMTVLGWAASEFARIHNKAERLLVESDPRTTVWMLPDWENNAGLPDNCAGVEAGTYQERIDALVARLIQRGGQSLPYYIMIAEQMGYSIEIDEYRPFIGGISAGGDAAYLDGHIVRYIWRVRVSAAKLVYFIGGLSAGGDKQMAIRRAEALECVLNRLKPAHTHLIIGYEGV